MLLNDISRIVSGTRSVVFPSLVKSVQFYTVNTFRLLSYIKGRHWHAVCVPPIQLLKRKIYFSEPNINDVSHEATTTSYL